MRRFLEHGFSGTSYEDLVVVAGVSRKGLYAEFGAKEDLFLAALRRYRKTIAREIFAGLEVADISLADIRAVVESIAQRVVEEEERNGCLMANASMDGAVDSAAIRGEITDHLDWISDCFANALRRAGVHPDQCVAVAHYLTGVVQGMFLMGRARAPRSLIVDHARIALEASVLN